MDSLDFFRFWMFVAENGMSGLVFPVGMLIAGLFLSRYRGPAIMAFVGCGLAFASRLLHLLTFYLVTNGRYRDNAYWVDWLAPISSLLMVFGTAVLLAAVFSGRRTPNAVGERNS